MKTQIEISRTGITPWLLATLFAIASPTTLMAKGPGNGGGGGGGGGKVSVTLATPSEASQGEELDVIIDGSGFDDGSTATWYLTGTSDDTQVQVLSNEYLPATGQLKSRIRVNGGAVVSDYDIEVQNSGGRRGKGTTLFKVSSSGGGGQNDPCGTDGREPTIAYLTGFKSVDGVNSGDIMLANETGCKLTLLVEGAHQYRTPNGNNEGQFIQSVWKLSYSARGDRGFVAWVDDYKTPNVVMGIGFSFDAQGDITLDSAEPQALYTPDGRTVDEADVHLKWNDAAQTFDVLLAMIEYSETDGYDRLLSALNVSSGEYEVISQGPCHMTDAGGCWHPSWWKLEWSPDGEAIHYALHNSLTENYLDGVGRSRLVDGAWQAPELILTLGGEDSFVMLGSVSSAGFMVYTVELPVYHHKNGRLLGTGSMERLLDLNANACGELAPCPTTDGIEIPRIQLTAANRRLMWTRDHRLVYWDVGSNNYVLEEIIDPLTGELGPLSIPNVQNRADTSE